MQTHEDMQHRRQFLDRLEQRADKCVKDRASEITIGGPGEKPLASWKAANVHVVHMPDDEQGILRISAGGGSHLPLELNYCTIRGKVGACIALLEKCIAALRECPE